MKRPDPRYDADDLREPQSADGLPEAAASARAEAARLLRDDPALSYGAANHSRTRAEFLARGEQAWREYQLQGRRGRRAKSSTEFRSASTHGANNCSPRHHVRAREGRCP